MSDKTEPVEASSNSSENQTSYGSVVPTEPPGLPAGEVSHDLSAPDLAPIPVPDETALLRVQIEAIGTDVGRLERALWRLYDQLRGIGVERPSDE